MLFAQSLPDGVSDCIRQILEMLYRVHRARPSTPAQVVEERRNASHAISDELGVEYTTVTNKWRRLLGLRPGGADALDPYILDWVTNGDSGLRDLLLKHAPRSTRALDTQAIRLLFDTLCARETPPLPTPPPRSNVVLDYPGMGSVNTPPFAVRSSPWKLEFSSAGDAHLRVTLKPVGDLLVNQDCQAGRTYTTFVYSRTETCYLAVEASSPSYEWLLRATDHPNLTPVPTATRAQRPSAAPTPTP